MQGATVTVRPEEFSAATSSYYYEDSTPNSSSAYQQFDNLVPASPLCSRHQQQALLQNRGVCNCHQLPTQPRSNLRCTCRPCRCNRVRVKRRSPPADCVGDCRRFWADVGQCFVDCGVGIMDCIMGCFRDCMDFGRGCLKGCTPEPRPCPRCNMGNQCPRHGFY